MQTTTEKNKQAVIRFNHEFVIAGKMEAFNELVAEDFIDHSAPPGTSNGSDGLLHFVLHILKKGFPDLRVDILEQVAEGDKVMTRKVFTGTHTRELMGIPPTNQEVAIKVIDIITLRDGQYTEHWVESNFMEILTRLSTKS
jgi:predicted ester cyclase